MLDYGKLCYKLSLLWLLVDSIDNLTTITAMELYPHRFIETNNLGYPLCSFVSPLVVISFVVFAYKMRFHKDLCYTNLFLLVIPINLIIITSFAATSNILNLIPKMMGR
jgi:hypothetical protein